MPEGRAYRHAVWAHNRVLRCDATQVECLCSFIGLLTVYIYFTCSRRNVNSISHLLPVSVWAIVSRKIILLPAVLIPLPEEANRSRPKINCMNRS